MRGPIGALLRAFDRAFDRATRGYASLVALLLRRLAIGAVAVAAFGVAAGAAAWKLPTGFVPDEDLGYFYAVLRLPDGASLQRSDALARRAEQDIRRLDGVQNVVTQGGFDQLSGAYTSNSASFIVILRPWEERRAAHLHAAAIVDRLRRVLAGYPEALAVVAVPPPIPGLGAAGGLQLELQDRAGRSAQELQDAAEEVARRAGERHELVGVYSGFRTTVPQVRLDVDREKAKSLGIPITDVFDGLQVNLGGLQVNDFNLFGRTYKVVLQAEPEFRAVPDQLRNIHVRTAAGDMVPISTLSTLRSRTGPDVIQRHDMFRSAELSAANPPGVSTGQAIAALEETARKVLPPGFGFEWSGTAFQEKAASGSQALILAMGLVFVFLFLAAQYESWTVPFGVLLGLPLGIFGALAAVGLRGLVDDVYAQIGIVMLMGLAAKNAILIVAFARMKHGQEHLPVREAALEGARLRFRPILMTSFAFILGVVPLVVASGAGAASRRTMGTAVFGGMTAATALGVLLIPVLYAVVELLAARLARAPRPVTGSAPPPPADASHLDPGL